MSALYPGQRVICIDGKLSPDVWEWTSQIPREGEIYTIQRAYDGTNRISGRREAGVDLVEVDTFLPGSLKGRLGWYAGRFAPLDIETMKVCVGIRGSAYPLFSSMQMPVKSVGNTKAKGDGWFLYESTSSLVAPIYCR